jgi:hypothetical protein
VANVRNGNTFYVDTSSDSGTATSYIDARGTRVLGIIADPAANTDAVAIFDKASGSAAAGSKKLNIEFDTAKHLIHINLADTPLLFPNGLWVTLTGSPKVTFILDGTS